MMKLFKLNIILLLTLTIFTYSCGNIVIEDQDTLANMGFDNNSSSTKTTEIELLNIELDNGVSINEEIDTKTKEYTATVGLGLANLEITKIEVSPVGTKIKINGNEFTGTKNLDLNLGNNEIEISLSHGKETKNYNVTIVKGKGLLDYIKASNTESHDNFKDIAMSGDTLVVGAQSEDSNATGVNGDQSNNLAYGSGAVYVFKRSGGNWTQEAYLKASDTSINNAFGYSVAIDGDTIVVGTFTKNATYVFKKTAGSWTQEAYLTSSNYDSQDHFGSDVAVSGNTIVVGVSGEDSNATGINGDETDNSMTMSGAAYVFIRNAGIWTQEAYLKASNTGTLDAFGLSVAIDGDTIVVGALQESSNATGINGDENNDLANESGAAYIFTRNAGVWTQEAYLKASNTNTNDHFGSDVAINEDTVVVGASYEESNATGINGDENNNTKDNSGATYVFIRNAGVWTQEAYLKASNTWGYTYFGHSVAIDKDTIVVGSYNEHSNATGINGDQNNFGASQSGSAYVFTRSMGIWTQDSYLKATNTGSGDSFGDSVALSNNIIAIGARGEDSDSTEINGDGSNNNASGSGAVYTFE